MLDNKCKKKIMLFTLNFIAYSIMLFYKYAKNLNSEKISTVIEGYFLVNIFFLIMIFPVFCIHRLLKKNDLFLNNEFFSKVLQILLLIGTYIILIRIPYLEIPLDVMSSFIFWLYLYFCIIFNAD